MPKFVSQSKHIVMTAVVADQHVWHGIAVFCRICAGGFAVPWVAVDVALVGHRLQRVGIV